MVENQEVRVRGTVQGVGFRPTVYRLAIECQLNGEVSNDSDGVLVRLSGVQENIQRFLCRLRTEAPPLAKIDAIESLVINDNWQYKDFSISQSCNSQGQTEITADATCCSACLGEVFDPNERRYLYPFTNCTHCGPRLSIVQGIPYDRSNTTMQSFPLCSDCEKEYLNPLDRRFHAQPVACHKCGPKLFIHSEENVAIGTDVSDSSNEEQSLHSLFRINQALKAGKIVAIKGLGGFHLCCDAYNHQAVSLLRKRKQRYAKPFALMSHDLNCIKQHCDLSAQEIEALESSAAPIVLLKQREQCGDDVSELSSTITPGSKLMGFMLPYTPLHNIICRQFDGPLVMTSGNLSGDPQIIENDEAIEKLIGIADLIVYHDRDIANRIDDSVLRFVSGRPRLMRRARGYAPRSIAMPEGFQQAGNILAYGAELKSTFCLLQKGVAILSQHQGDLENLSTFDDYEHNLALYKQLFEFTPDYLAFDKHPEYLSTKLARLDAEEQQLTSHEVQHHHAHIASAMVENQISLSHAPVLGIALDGLGFGGDNTLWGGEFLLADYCDYQRVARFKPVAMPGASQAVKQPWRNTYAHILNAMSWDDFSSRYGNTELAAFFTRMPIATLEAMLSKQLNCPVASSAGRLFDAVAGAIGLNAEQVQFEGQAAIELEMLVDADAVTQQRVGEAYRFAIEQSENSNAEILGEGISAAATPTSLTTLINLNASGMWPQLLDDLQKGVSKSDIATRFHAGLIDGIINVVDQLSQNHSFADVALSGGCLQNAILLSGLEQRLRQRGFNCLSHCQVPANDGGIALGQAAIAAARNLAATDLGVKVSDNSATYSAPVKH
ncbi:MAG TPA: carbamoyltransferase HypF [Methyloprofundus sp.]|nr:carbamoyltransferase HypF [Methyloprofundus sp.]HIL79448.1 carbamoyltransferase HypF [Methylococcales bacterium]